MIAHVVLFRPRADLAGPERSALVESLALALREIPSVRRSRVGRRVRHGRGYERLMKENYDYAAIIEFDDMDGLKVYLQHPAHETLAQRFFAACEAALMYDYEIGEEVDALGP